MGLSKKSRFNVMKHALLSQFFICVKYTRVLRYRFRWTYFTLDLSHTFVILGQSQYPRLNLILRIILLWSDTLLFILILSTFVRISYCSMNAQVFACDIDWTHTIGPLYVPSVKVMITMRKSIWAHTYSTTRTVR